MWQKALATILLFIFCLSAKAVECEPVLKRFFSIIEANGELKVDSTNVSADLDKTKFTTCYLMSNGREFTLLLHSDEKTIYIVSNESPNKKSVLWGPFFSAYRK
jgi:hypothetical protein